MAIQKCSIDDFLELAPLGIVLDVRSPGEYNHAHMPGAHSFPLFTDEERKIVGTAYKQQSRQTAIKIGLDYFGVKMRKMVEEAEGLVTDHVKTTRTTKPENAPAVSPAIFVHCWRGGMRSAGVAWLLDLYGFKVYTLAGGYKVYRKWVRDQFEKEYNFNIIGGYTGSGKTLVLHELMKTGQLATDLEKLGNHKGSAFGALGELPQPSQEMFENLLAESLSFNNKTNLASTIWIEDESQRIGQLQLPMPLWLTMRKSPVWFVEIPFEERLDYLTKEYGSFEKEKLVNAVIRIQKRLGGLETKNAINFLLENNHREAFRILLTYYDKWYKKGLENRATANELVNKISFEKVDAQAITSLLKDVNGNVVKELSPPIL